MVVDCESSTVDSTTIKLLEDERLSVMTERKRDDYDDNFVDQEFIKFLENDTKSLVFGGGAV